LNQLTEEATNAMFRRDEELDHSAKADPEGEEMARASRRVTGFETSAGVEKTQSNVLTLDGSGTG
jgi:hypothetical protein